MRPSRRQVGNPEDNDALSSSGHIASYVKMIILKSFKGCGQKRSWPNLRYVYYPEICMEGIRKAPPPQKT
jgi:hypothetical protein